MKTAAQRLAARHRRRFRVVASDLGRIMRPGTGQGPWNPEIGDYDPAPDVEVGRGHCVVARPTATDRVVVVGGTPHTLRDLSVNLHEDFTGEPQVGDRFELIEADNPHLLGRHWWVHSIGDGTHAPARTLTVSEEQPRG